MVRDPSRYCKCIPDYQLESMFCEARPTGLGLRNEIDEGPRGLIDDIKEDDTVESTASIVSKIYQSAL